MVRQWPGAKDNRRVVEVFGEAKPRLMPLPSTGSHLSKSALKTGEDVPRPERAC